MQDKTPPHINIHDALLLDGQPDTILQYYKKWSETYDADVIDNYFGIALICELMHQHLNDGGVQPDLATLQLVDVGCGTGLLGKPLHSLGYRILDGIDLSAEMIDKARQTGYYRNLHAGVNINNTLPEHLRGVYDAALCIGVFTPGHVLPDSLYQLAALTKPGGLIVASTRIPYYDTTNFQTISDQIQADGIARLIKQYKNAPYRDDGDAHYWVYEVL